MITVMTLCTQNWKAVGDLTLPHMASWCRRHGYELRVVETPPYAHTVHRGGGRTEPPWPKVQLLLDRLPLTDWLCWLDADILVRNPEFKLEELLNTDADMVLSRYPSLQFSPRPGHPEDVQQEKGGEVCIGSMVLRNTPAMREFLKVWLRTPRVEDRPDLTDQGALLSLLRPGTAAIKIKYVGESEFADYNWWDRGAPMLHFCMGSAGDKHAAIAAYSKSSSLL